MTVFEWVVAGKTFVAMAYLAMDIVVEMFPGPLAVDQEVFVTLSAAADVNSFVGRVLDQGREPIGDADFQISYEYDGRGWGDGQFHTDERGFFRVPIQRIFDREMTMSRLTIQNQSRTFPPEDSISYTSTQQRPLIAGDNNLGDVILEPTPVIASGHILVAEETRLRIVEAQHNALGASFGRLLEQSAFAAIPKLLDDGEIAKISKTLAEADQAISQRQTVKDILDLTVNIALTGAKIAVRLA